MLGIWRREGGGEVGMHMSFEAERKEGNVDCIINLIGISKQSHQGKLMNSFNISG